VAEDRKVSLNSFLLLTILVIRKKKREKTRMSNLFLRYHSESGGAEEGGSVDGREEG